MKTAASRRRLMERLEREALEAPGPYRIKLALLAALGYAVLLGALLLTLGLVVSLVLYMLIVRPPIDPYIAIPIIVLGLAGTMIVRALWIRFEAPEGYRLGPGEGQELQDEIERIRAAVGAGRLHGIVINGELNAAAAYVPSGIGLWGQRHYLILGLPLLQALDRRELAAVVAHEFGHFHGGHGHFASWIYRLRSSWYWLMDGTSGHGMWGGQLLWLFFRWYAPYFDAYSFVLARRHEYAADSVAAQVAGANATASALVRMKLVSDWLHGEFWPGVQLSARAQAYPPLQVYERLGEGLERARVIGSRVPARLLGRDGGFDDTHPTLEQRLAALGVDPALSLVQSDTEAAVGLLGPLAPRLQQELSQQWRTSAEAQWQAQHRVFQTEHSRLTALEAHPTHSPDEMVELACLSEDHRPSVDALPLMQAALQRAPSNASGQYRLGALLLGRGQVADAIDRLERAVELEEGLCAMVMQRLDRHARGLPDEAATDTRFEALRLCMQALMQAPHADAMAGTELDHLPHGLEDAHLRALARTLRGYDKVRAAWVVRKRSEGASVMPHYLVLLDWAGSVASERVATRTMAGQLQLPGSCAVLSVAGNPELAARVRRNAGEVAYRRTQ